MSNRQSDGADLSAGGSHGTPGEQPQCPECGAWMRFVDESEEIQEAIENGLPADEVPPGYWGYWECPRGCGDVA